MTETRIWTGYTLLVALVLFDGISLGNALLAADFAGSPAQAPAGPATDMDRDLRRCFAEPPQRYWPRPLWFWNNTRVTAEAVRDQMRQARGRSRYGGFGILPFGKDFSPAYLSDEYFTVYAAALEQYTKGINLLIPHAVWYDDRKVTFKPELSWRNPLYAERLPEFNTYLARLNVLLQNDAAHVADIAVLYPIATLQGSHHLDGPLGYYQGGVAVPEADYVTVGELLAVDLGRDYTFLHPEVLEDKCILDSNHLVLPNQIHPGRFRVLVLPGHKTIRWNSLRKIKAFYDQGGRVIATGRLPFRSAEFGHDADVVRTMEELFGAAASETGEGKGAMIRRNPQGGCAIHLHALTAESLRKALDATRTVPEVAFETGPTLRYIHKCWKGRHIYFFANLNAKPTESTVTLRGRHDLETWDPHTGRIQTVQAAHGSRSGSDFTRIRLSLRHLESLFLVSSRAAESGTVR